MLIVLINVCVRLRQRSPDGECIPVVMRDTISFLSEQGNCVVVVIITNSRMSLTVFGSINFSISKSCLYVLHHVRLCS